MLKLFKSRVIDITVWGNSIDAIREFDQGCDFIPQDWLDGIRTMIGGFDDGHSELVLPIKTNKIKELDRRIRVFNKYANHFGVNYEVRRVG